MKHVAKKFLLFTSFIFSLNFFGMCYAATYSAGAIAAEIGVNLGTIGAMFASIASSINASRSAQVSASATTPPLRQEATLELYEDVGGTLTLIPADQDIVLKKAQATQTFVYKNVSGVDWLSPSVSWQTMFDDIDPGANPTGSEYYVALTNNTCNSVSSISPGGSCSFNLVTYFNHPGDWGIIKATGDNLSGGTQYKNVLAGSGLEITINFDSAMYHLGYRSIKLTNTIPDGNMHIRSIAIGENLAPATDPLVKYCPPGDTDCAYKTDCTISPTRVISLAPNASCLVWLKAKSKKTDNTTDIDLQTIPATTGRIKIMVDAEKQIQGGTWVDISNYEKDLIFKTTYNKSLYAGGKFYLSVPEGFANHITRWDGTRWYFLEPYGASYDRPVFAITKMNGDLYMDGYFYFMGNLVPGTSHVAKWDGTNWSGLGGGVNNDGYSIYARDVMDNILYVGGWFSSAGGIPGTDKIAAWNDKTLTWTPFGTGMNNTVYAMSYLNGDVYAGGVFTIAGGNPINFIAKWNAIDGWTALGSPTSINSAVGVITNINNILYVGGHFTDAGGNLNADYIAKWDGSSWAEVGAGLTGYVSAITKVGTSIYVTGGFTNVGGNPNASYIIQWDGTSWLPLSSGTDYIANTLTSLNNDLYVAGTFGRAGSIAATNIAQWNTISSSWSALGDGIPGPVYSIVIAPALDVTDYYWPGT